MGQTNFVGSVAIMKTESPGNTAAVIETSGTAVFTGSVDVAGPINASASAVYTQPIFIGPSGARGTVLVTQQVTIVHTNTAGAPVSLTMPNAGGSNLGTDIIDFIIDIEEPFDTAAGATAGNIECTAAGGTAVCTIPVSASGRYAIKDANASNIETLRSIKATVEAWVSIQGSNTTLSTGQAILTVVYRPGGV